MSKYTVEVGIKVLDQDSNVVTAEATVINRDMSKDDMLKVENGLIVLVQKQAAGQL